MKNQNQKESELRAALSSAQKARHDILYASYLQEDAEADLIADESAIRAAALAAHYSDLMGAD
jgi:hypothetical protein